MKKYSTASDVWSFGCLMYEIWSLGHKPFEGYTNPEVPPNPQCTRTIDKHCQPYATLNAPLDIFKLIFDWTLLYK